MRGIRRVWMPGSARKENRPGMSDNQPPALRATPLKDLQAFVQRGQFPVWRARQVFQWVFRHDARSFEEMSNVPSELRAVLAEGFRWGGIADVAAERHSADGTIKFLFRLADGAQIESVLMPEEDHYSLCVSSQVGCPLKCGFCLTGRIGFRRDLDAAEIVDQVLYSRRRLRERQDPRPLRNLVFMGMGEPLLNPHAVIGALRLLLQPDGAGFSPRRITVSTAGIVPGLEQLGASGLGVGLAISLNASTQETREHLMPIAKKYPLEAVLEACRAYPLTHRRRITFEYVMLRGINDAPEDALRLARLLHGIPSKINLIPFNEHSSLPYRRPEDSALEAFRELLASKNYTATIRYSKGQDIEAACGQLAGAATLDADGPPHAAEARSASGRPAIPHRPRRQKARS